MVSIRWWSQYEVVFKILRTGAAIYTAVVTARSTGPNRPNCEFRVLLRCFAATAQKLAKTPPRTLARTDLAASAWQRPVSYFRPHPAVSGEILNGCHPPLTVRNILDRPSYMSTQHRNHKIWCPFKPHPSRSANRHHRHHSWQYCSTRILQLTQNTEKSHIPAKSVISNHFLASTIREVCSVRRSADCELNTSRSLPVCLAN
jgi:hypothetical protein